MQLVESFLSIQGEGKYSGKLAISMRFAGCNFNCSGFGVKLIKNGETLKGCDTIRAVFTKEFNEEYEILNVSELSKRVLDLKKDFNPIVVITGREPLIHHENPEFIDFIRALLKNNFEVHFESSGNIELGFEKYPSYKECVFALGVKLQSSGMGKEKRLNFNTLKGFKHYAKDSSYKFVLNSSQLGNLSLEILEILEKTPNGVFCTPMGEDEQNLKQDVLKIAESCIKNGYNYSDRIHIRLWNDKEGV